MPVDDIVAKVGWFSESTFTKNYMRPLEKFKNTYRHLTVGNEVPHSPSVAITPIKMPKGSQLQKPSTIPSFRAFTLGLWPPPLSSTPKVISSTPDRNTSQIAPGKAAQTVLETHKAHRSKAAQFNKLWKRDYKSRVLKNNNKVRIDKFKKKHIKTYNPLAKKGIKKAIANLCKLSPKTVVATDPELVTAIPPQPSPEKMLSEGQASSKIGKRVSWSDKIPAKEILKHKLLQKSPNLQTELTIDDIMSTSFMQEHLLELEIEEINPDVFNMTDKNIDSYSTFENDKLAALQSRRKLFSSDRGTTVHDPDRKQDTEPPKTSKLINKPDTKSTSSGPTAPGTRIPYDKLTATKYTFNKLKFLNYTPKYPDQHQDSDIVEITIDNDDPETETGTKTPQLLTKQIKTTQAVMSTITTTTEMPSPTSPPRIELLTLAPQPSLVSSSAVPDTRVLSFNPTFTQDCLLQIQPANPIHLVPQFSLPLTPQLLPHSFLPQIPQATALVNLFQNPTPIPPTSFTLQKSMDVPPTPFTLQKTVDPPPAPFTLQKAMDVTWEPNKKYVILVPVQNQIQNRNTTNMITGPGTGDQQGFQG